MVDNSFFPGHQVPAAIRLSPGRTMKVHVRRNESDQKGRTYSLCEKIVRAIFEMSVPLEKEKVTYT